MFDAKRMIGRDWSDKTVQNNIKFCPFTTIEKSSKPHMQGDTSHGIKTFGPEEINVMVLTKTKETSKVFLGKKATHKVCGYWGG